MKRDLIFVLIVITVSGSVGIVDGMEAVLDNLLTLVPLNESAKTDAEKNVSVVVNATAQNKSSSIVVEVKNETSGEGKNVTVVGNKNGTDGVARNGSNSSEATQCDGSSLKCVLRPKDIDKKEAFQTYNLSFLDDICQKECLNGDNCKYMTTVQLEDLIHTKKLEYLGKGCLKVIPVTIWEQLPQEVLDAELSRDHFVLKSWFSSGGEQQVPDPKSFIPKLVKLPNTRKTLFSPNLKELTDYVCQYIQIKDFNVSQLADVTFGCMKIMMNESSKCSSIPDGFFDIPANQSEYQKDLAVVMDHMREALTSTCFNSIQKKPQTFIVDYVKTNMKDKPFNGEILNTISSNITKVDESSRANETESKEKAPKKTDKVEEPRPFARTAGYDFESSSHHVRLLNVMFMCVLPIFTCVAVLV